MQKINIVLLTDCLADLAGGAEKQIYELAKRLDKAKYNVFVVSLDCWGKAPRELIESTGSKLEIFRVVRIYGISGLIQGIRFYHFLRQNQIHTILTYHFSSDMWGTFWGKAAGVPFIISNRRDMGFWRNGGHIKAYRLMNRWVKKIIVVSQSIKDMVIETEAVPADDIKVIYNGVDLPKLQEMPVEQRQQLGIKQGDMVILHVANLKPVKGHQYLIEAFADVAEKYPQAKLALIGKDELNGKIQELASVLKIKDNVLFWGKQDNIPLFLTAADICVLPSLSEGMSNSILEYMASAKPVIATRVGGNPELVKDGFNGLLVDKENALQLKDALLKLIQDSEIRKQMGKNGLLRVRNEFSMEAMMKQYENLLTSLNPPKKTRVLHLVSSGGLFGAERVILNLAKRCEKVDSYVGAIYNFHNPHLEVIEEAKALGINHITFSSSGRFDMRTIKEVKTFLVENDIDILHTHNYKADIIGFWATRLAGKKWIATNHLWHSTDRKLRLYEMIDSLALKFAQKIVSVSDEIKKDLLKKGFSSTRLEVIDNGIPVENFGHGFPVTETRKSLGIRDGQLAVLIVGRLAPEKGHDVFLKAASKVLEKSKNVKFIIVGDGPLNEVLKQKSKELDLTENVIFTGIRQDIANIYASCDVMVNASYIEGLPMTILEAMASRLPVIATNVGGVGKVIENQRNGILLEAGDPETLANSLHELLIDEAKRKRFAQAAYKDVCDRYSDSRMANKYQEIYFKIL